MSEIEGLPAPEREPSQLLKAMYDARATREQRDDAALCETSLSHFIKRAWPELRPEDVYMHNWHIDAVAEKLEAVTAGEITRLQIWLPPGAMKSLSVSVFWPAWEWTTRPNMRYWSASYEVSFASRLAAMSRDLMLSDWYQERWGDRFKFVREGERYYGNDKGGTRLATAPQSTGSGEHGHRLLIDDPINAQFADTTSKVSLHEVNDWYDTTVVTRGMDIGFTHARILVMQRLQEADLAAHMLELEDWDVLCLPERYEAEHPFVWPKDPRTEEGELLWPDQRDDKASNALAASLRPHRAAGQLQQRPAAKEGDLLKASWWRFYDPRLRDKGKWDELPAFSMVVMTLDCPLKDKETNDNIAIQIWGVHGLRRYLLDIELGKMNYSKAKRRTIEMAVWARRTWPRARHVILIENTGYGSDLITDLKSQFTGLTKISPQQDGDKVVRADRASESLESLHCFLPGTGPGWGDHSEYLDTESPDEVAAFIHSCARFPNAAHDDDVDAWSQMINWLRTKQPTPLKTSSAMKAKRNSGTTASNTAGGRRRRRSLRAR